GKRSESAAGDVHRGHVRLAALEGGDEEPIGGRGRVVEFQKGSPFRTWAATGAETSRWRSRGHDPGRAVKRDRINENISGRRGASRTRLGNHTGGSTYIHKGARCGGAGVVGVVEDRGMHVALIACANRCGDERTEVRLGLDQRAICT